MPTKIKKIISGKYFSVILTLLYTLLMFFTAYETNWALRLLSGRPHLYGAVYILFAIVTILVILKEGFRFNFKNRIYRKTSAFLNCIILYHILITLAWGFLCLMFDVIDTVKSIGIVASLIVAIPMDFTVSITSNIRHKNPHARVMRI